MNKAYGVAGRRAHVAPEACRCRVGTGQRTHPFAKSEFIYENNLVSFRLVHLRGTVRHARARPGRQSDDLYRSRWLRHELGEHN